MALLRIPALGVGLLSAAALGLFAGPAPAQPYVWNNAAGGPWQTMTNWTPNGTPGGSDTATIAISTGSPVTMAGTTAIGTLTVSNSGATLDASGQMFTVNTLLNLQAGTLMVNATSAWS